MSTPAQPTLGLEDLVKQEYEKIKQQAAGNNPPAPPAVNSPSQPLKMTIGGQEQSFNSAEEMQNYINNVLQAQQQAAQQAIAAVHQQLGQSVTASQMTQEQPKPDLQEFAKRLEKDPADAFNYIDKFRFGVENVPAVLQGMAAQLSALTQVNAVYQFRDMHPEFERNPQNAEALQNIMRAYNLPLTYDGLEMAYSVARDRNMLTQAQQQQEDLNQGFESPIQPRPTSTPVAPPRLGRGISGEPAPDILAQAEDLDADTLGRIIMDFEKMGARRG